MTIIEDVSLPVFVPVVLLLAALTSGTSSLDVTPVPAAVSSIEYVFVIARHGSRTPSETYANDPYPFTDRKFWPNGPVELTNVGKVQAFHTGQNLRKRYKYFLNYQYNPDDVDLQYNPYNRDYMSASCIAAGLYPPSGSQIWNSALLWQPVILRVRNFDVCDLGSVVGMCPKFRKRYFDQMSKLNSVSNQHQDLIDYVSMNAGEKYTQLSQVMEIYELLLLQEENGLKLPKWAEMVYPKILKPIALPYIQQIIAGTEDQIRLGAGPELKHISEMMMMKANGTYGNNKKLYIETSHDCTLIVLLAALGHNDQNIEIKSSAYIVFELHKALFGHVVQVLYFQNGEDITPVNLAISGCPTPCSLSNFVTLVDSINPTDFNKECQI